MNNKGYSYEYDPSFEEEGPDNRKYQLAIEFYSAAI